MSGRRLPRPLAGLGRLAGGAGALRVRRMLAKELRQIFRDPRMKRVIFVAPIIQLVVFGYAVNTDIRHTSTFVVDHDRTATSRALLDALTAGGYFRVVGRSERPADLLAALDRGGAIVGVEIPAGFARDVAAGRSARVQVLVDGTNSNTATVVQANAVRIVGAFAARQAPRAGPAPASAREAGPTDGPLAPRLEAAPVAAAPAPPAGVDLRARAWYNPDLASRVYNVPAVVGVILMLMCLLLTAMTVVREREAGTLEQLMVTPLSPVELMLGKTLPVALIAFADLILITSVAILWFDVPFRGSAVALLLASALYIAAGLSFGLLLSTVARTQQEALMVLFLFFLPAIVLSGFMFPIFTMPPLFQWLTLANPLRHFIEIVRGIFLKADGVAALWPQYLALFVMATLTLTVATRRFRRSL